VPEKEVVVVNVFIKISFSLKGDRDLPQEKYIRLNVCQKSHAKLVPADEHNMEKVDI
jgi:hypothetical protein